MEMQHLRFPSMTNLFSCPRVRLEWQLSFSSNPQGKGRAGTGKNKRHSFIDSVFHTFNTLLWGSLISNHCGRCCGGHRGKWQHPCPLRVYSIPEENDSTKILHISSIFTWNWKHDISWLFLSFMWGTWGWTRPQAASSDGRPTHSTFHSANLPFD